MSESAALEGFLDKWRQRWPEWSVVEVFVPASERRIALAWFALLQEFEDALNIAGDPLPADAKLGWWGQELHDWSQHRARHPLGRVLQPCEAPWGALANALPLLVRARSRPLDQDTAFLTLAPLTSAACAVEAALFKGQQDDVLVRAIAAQLLASRLRQGGIDAVPMQLNGNTNVSVHAWRSELLRHWPTPRSAGTPRRLWSALGRSRLLRSPTGEAVVPPSPAKALWIGWRAARR